MLVLLYPLACNNSLRMVHCQTLTLDGDRSLRLAAAGEYKCFSGDHLPAGLLAIAVLLLHVLLFPLVTFVYLHRHRREFISVDAVAVAIATRQRGLFAWKQRSDDSKQGASDGSSRGGGVDGPAASSPSAAVVRKSRVDVRGARDSAGGGGGMVAARWRRLWAVFLHDEYEARCFWIVHLDLLSLALLSVVIEFCAAPTLLSQAAAFAASVVAIGGVLAAKVFARPFVPSCTWKLPVQSFGLLVSLWAVIVNLCAFLLLRPDGEADTVVTSSAAVDVLSYILFALCLILAAVFLGSYVWSLRRPQERFDRPKMLMQDNPMFASPSGDVVHTAGGGGGGSAGAQASLKTGVAIAAPASTQPLPRKVSTSAASVIARTQLSPSAQLRLDDSRSAFSATLGRKKSSRQSLLGISRASS
jgi:hypothetical protein